MNVVDITALRAELANTPPWFVDDKFKPALLADHLAAEAHLERGSDGRLYRYADGVYTPDGDDWIKTETRRLLGTAARRHHLTEVHALAAARMPTAFDQPDPDRINLANGLLDLRADRLEPHTPAHRSTTQLPVEYDPVARCPAFDRFLADVIDPENHPLVDEILAAAISPTKPWRRAVLLIGPGANGKSTLLRVLGALLGTNNTAACSLQRLAENRFAAADLFGKLANIGGDLDARAIRTSDTFKTITGGDTITAERKNGQPFTFQPHVFLVFAANTAPTTHDQSDAWFDRWIILPMRAHITHPDPNITERLTTPTELAGILTRAVAGLKRLRARGGFTTTATTRHAADDYRQGADTVAAWIADECDTTDPTARTPRAHLRTAYQAWTERNYTAAVANFYDALADRGFAAGKAHGGGRYHTGIRLK